MPIGVPTENHRCHEASAHDPLRIAVVEPSGLLYGSEYALLDILDGLPRESFTWQVILPAGGGFDELLRDRRIECRPLLPHDIGQVSFWRKASAYARILLHLRRMMPHLIYVNQTGILRSVALYARILRLPVVCQVQTLEDAQWLSRNRGLHGPVQAFLCNSEFIANETDLDPAKKCVLYQGLPENRLQHAIRNRRSACSRLTDELVVGILGRIAASKGHYLLLEAAKRLMRELPHCRFVVIGEGLTRRDTQAFEAEVERNGLAPVFELRGYRPDVAKELERVHILVIPSLAEPLGRVLFDAAEHGTPVVLSDAGGLGELSRRFTIGVRFETGNASALADAIAHTANNYVGARHDFRTASVDLFRRLRLESYLETIGGILVAAARWNLSNVKWLGD